jgi:hypothetical protein
MTTPPKKRGRKPRPYVCPWNNATIDGLYHCPDGRWRITATGEKFSEADPRRAVTRFREWEARQQGNRVFISLPLDSSTPSGSLSSAVDFIVRHELGPGEHRAPHDDSLVLRIPSSVDPIALLRAIPEDAYYAHVANDIMSRPQYVAQRTGIEQIGYLSQIRRPTPGPSLDELGDLYFRRKDIDVNWMSKCRSFWAEFQEIVAVEGVRAVDQDKVTEYKDAVEDRQRQGNEKHPTGFAPPYVRQRFDGARRRLPRTDGATAGRV